MKHVAQRTCVACRQVRPKQEMVRLVGDADGGVFADETGKSEGRGAYLCKNQQCWLKAVGNGKRPGKSPLGLALKAQLTEADRAALLEYAEHLSDLSEI